MNKLQKIFSYLTLFLLNFSFSFAENGQIGNPIQAKNLNDFFLSITSVCITLGTIIASLAIMYGGFMYVTAQGDEEKINKARTTLTWALVGTAVLLGARVIMTAIQSTVNQLQ